MRAQFSPPLELPPQAKVEDEMLYLLSGRSKGTEAVRVYSELGNAFGLSQSQQHASRPNTSGSAWEYLVRQAKRRLLDERWLVCPEHGVWMLTAAGEAQAARVRRAKTVTPEELGL